MVEMKVTPPTTQAQIRESIPQETNPFQTMALPDRRSDPSFAAERPSTSAFNQSRSQSAKLWDPLDRSPRSQTQLAQASEVGHKTEKQLEIAAQARAERLQAGRERIINDRIDDRLQARYDRMATAIDEDTRRSITKEVKGESVPTHTEITGAEKAKLLERLGLAEDPERPRSLFVRTVSTPTATGSKEVSEYVFSADPRGARGSVLPKALITEERSIDHNGTVGESSIIKILAGKDGDRRIHTSITDKSGATTSETITATADSITIDSRKTGESIRLEYSAQGIEHQGRIALEGRKK